MLLRRTRVALCYTRAMKPGATGIDPRERGSAASKNLDGSMRALKQHRMRRSEKDVGSVVVSAGHGEGLGAAPVPSSSRAAAADLEEDPFAAADTRASSTAAFRVDTRGGFGREERDERPMDADDEEEVHGFESELSAAEGMGHGHRLPSHLERPADHERRIAALWARSKGETGAATSDTMEEDYGGDALSRRTEPSRGWDAVSAAADDATTAAASGDDGVGGDPHRLQFDGSDAQTPGLPLGGGVDLHVERVTSYGEGVDPWQARELDRHQRWADKEAGERRRRDGVVKLPRHLDKLMQKIAGFSVDLKDDEIEGDLVGPSDPATRRGWAAESGDDPSLQAKMQVAQAKSKLRYGALMDAEANDAFAKEQKLAVVGTKAERQFVRWEGRHVLENDAAADFEEAKDTKAAVLLTNGHGMKIPKPGRDCCSGCGSTFQMEDDSQAGFTSTKAIAKYVQKWEEATRLRAEYADRMHELQKHWEKHGRRVGEEWLDYMTQEEFKAIHRFNGRAMLCLRCHHLRQESPHNFAMNALSLPKHVMQAQDFSKELVALKEKRCVVVLVVDIADFPGSMIPDLPGMLSMNNDVIIAVNKLDAVALAHCDYGAKAKSHSRSRLSSDSPAGAKFEQRMKSYLSAGYIKQWVLDQATRFRLPQERIKAVIPVSSRRGWGVVDLIAEIEKRSGMHLDNPRAKGKLLPVYFVGCTNVGKSSLINMIIRKMSPNIKPHPQAERVVTVHKNEKTGNERIVSEWKVDLKKHAVDYVNARTTKALIERMTVSPLPGTTIKTTAIKVAGDKGSDSMLAPWYDTPGVHPHWVASSPMSLLDQSRSTWSRYRPPLVLMVTPGTTIFLSAYCAVEVVSGPPQMCFFVYTPSKKTTVDMCPSENARDFWGEVAGRTLTPPGAPELVTDEATLSVSRSYFFECFGNRRTPKADIYFCGIGWMSFCTVKDADVVIRVRTAPGVIHGVRRPLCYRAMKMFPKWPARMADNARNEGRHKAHAKNQALNELAASKKGAAADLSPERWPLLRARDAADEDASVDAGGAASGASLEVGSAASSMPFDDLLEDLQQRGVVVDTK